MTFNLARPVRVEKLRAVNQLQEQTARAVLEMSSRIDLSPEEIAWVMIGAVAMVLRNRAGPKSLSKNLRSVAGKLHQYAEMLDKKDAKPTDDILVN